MTQYPNSVIRKNFENSTPAIGPMPSPIPFYKNSGPSPEFNYIRCKIIGAILGTYDPRGVHGRPRYPKYPKLNRASPPRRIASARPGFRFGVLQHVRWVELRSRGDSVIAKNFENSTPAQGPMPSPSPFYKNSGPSPEFNYIRC